MRRVYVAGQVVLAGVVMVFVARSLTRNWSELTAVGGAIHLDLVALASAAGIVLATYALLIGAWRAVLRGWGERLRYPVAARIWCVSNLARYVPGRIWQIAGMAALAQRAGITPWAAAGSAIIVQLLAIATGALVTGLAAPQAEHPMWVGVSAVVAGVAVVLLAGETSTEWIARAASRATGRDVVLKPVGKGALALSAAVTTVAWAAYGVALYLCTAALLGRAALGLVDAIGVFAGSYLAGLLAVFTPGGLGVRESVLYLWLAGPLGPAAALIVSLGSRLLLTATEVLAALITLPLAPRPSDGR